MLKSISPKKLYVTLILILIPVAGISYFLINLSDKPEITEKVFGEIEEEPRKDSQPNNTETDQTWGEEIVPEVAQVISAVKQEKSAVPKIPPEDILIQVEKIEEPSLADAMSQYITSAEENIYGTDKTYAITSVTKYDANWYYISIGISDSKKQFIHEGTFDSQPLIAHRNIAQNWEIGIYGTDTFTSLLDSLPEEYISIEAKTYIDPNLALYSEYSIKPSETVTYKFPWPYGKARVWWDRGTAPTWHGGNGSTTIALDFGSSSSTDRDIVAAAKGTITHQCIGSKTVNLVVQDASGKKLEYFHFNKDELSSRLYNAQGALEATGKLVQQGEFLGKAQIGDFGYLNSEGQYVTDGCGIAFQTNSHLHFVFPKDSITLDDWTFTYPSLTATNDGSSKDAGSSFTSSNGSTTPPPPSTTINPSSLSTDVDGDGKADAIVVNNGSVVIRRSTGSEFSGNEFWTSNGFIGDIGNYFADVTGDGKADAIVVNNGSVVVRRSYTDPSDNKQKFKENEFWTSNGFIGDHGNYFADVTGDGKADAIVVNNGSIVVRRSYTDPIDEKQKFDDNEFWTSNGFIGDIGNFFADVTGDGKADAIVVNNGSIVVRRSTGSEFSGNEFWTSNGFIGDHGNYFADVTGDGKADAIVVNNGSVVVRPSYTDPSDNKQKFDGNEFWTSNGFIGDIGNYFADVTGDGKADAVVVNNGSVVIRRSYIDPSDDKPKFKDNEFWTSNGFIGDHGNFIY